MFLFFHTVMTYGSQMRYLKEFYRCREYASSENQSRWTTKKLQIVSKRKKESKQD